MSLGRASSIAVALLLTACFLLALTPSNAPSPGVREQLAGPSQAVGNSTSPPPTTAAAPPLDVVPSAAPSMRRPVTLAVRSPVPVTAPVNDSLLRVPTKTLDEVRRARETPASHGNPRDAPHTAEDYAEALGYNRRCAFVACEDFLAGPACHARTGVGGTPAPLGNWTAATRCVWGAAASHIPLLTKFKMRLPPQARRCADRACTCWQHERGPPVDRFRSVEWVRRALSAGGNQPRPLVFFGHSHQRRLFFTAVLAMQDIHRYVRLVYPDFNRADAVAWVCAVDAGGTSPSKKCTPFVAAVYIATPNPALDALVELGDVVRQSAAALDNRSTVEHSSADFPAAGEREPPRVPAFGAARAIVVVGRGMWDLEHADAGPEWLRATHSAFLRRAVEFFGDGAVVVAYLTHFVHTAVGGCMSPARQVQFRDAVRCAVASANVGLAPAARVRILDVFDLTATRAVEPAVLATVGTSSGPPTFLNPADTLQQPPKAAPHRSGGGKRRPPYVNPDANLPGMMPLGDGHHYDAPVLFSVFARLIEVVSDGVPDGPAAPTAPADLKGVGSLPRARGRYCGPCRTCTLGFPGGLFVGSWCEELRLRMASSHGDPRAAANVSAMAASVAVKRAVDQAVAAGRAERFAWVTHTLMAALAAEAAFPFHNRTLCPK